MGDSHIFTSNAKEPSTMPFSNELSPRSEHPTLPTRSGKARTAILLWLLGIPIPIIILIFVIKGCV